ncbi:MAG TPA: hypothetical protein VHA79_08505 [Mycobacteriales bacterium]|nr:hypothetical protein [Mycobacteriales bacterium]
MARMIVGGRELDLTMEEVAHKMRGVQPEPIREHIVEMFGTVYPPKQVLATVTGWDRQSFTTMEAQRVLSKVGFICRRAGHRPDGHPAFVLQQEGDFEPEPEPNVDEHRLAALESGLAVANQAIANLSARIGALEAAVA